MHSTCIGQLEREKLPLVPYTERTVSGQLKARPTFANPCIQLWQSQCLIICLVVLMSENTIPLTNKNTLFFITIIHWKIKKTELGFEIG